MECECYGVETLSGRVMDAMGGHGRLPRRGDTQVDP
jgi:hypothetical protein